MIVSSLIQPQLHRLAAQDFLPHILVNQALQFLRRGRALLELGKSGGQMLDLPGTDDDFARLRLAALD